MHYKKDIQKQCARHARGGKGKGDLLGFISDGMSVEFHVLRSGMRIDSAPRTVADNAARTDEIFTTRASLLYA